MSLTPVGEAETRYPSVSVEIGNDELVTIDKDGSDVTVDLTQGSGSSPTQIASPSITDEDSGSITVPSGTTYKVEYSIEADAGTSFRGYNSAGADASVSPGASVSAYVGATDYGSENPTKSGSVEVEGPATISYEADSFESGGGRGYAYSSASVNLTVSRIPPEVSFETALVMDE